MQWEDCRHVGTGIQHRSSNTCCKEKFWRGKQWMPAVSGRRQCLQQTHQKSQSRKHQKTVCVPCRHTYTTAATNPPCFIWKMGTTSVRRGWNSCEKTFFDIRITHPTSQSYSGKSLAEIYLLLILSEFFYLLLGHARLQDRSWAAIQLSHRPVHEVSGLDIEGQHGRQFVPTTFWKREG